MMIGQHGNSLLKVILNESDTYLWQLNQNAMTQIACLISVNLFKTKREKLISTKVRNQTNNQLLHFGQFKLCIILIQNELFSESDNVQKRIQQKLRQNL